MDYKKILPSQNLRINLLNFFDFIPDEIMIPLQYRISTGEKLNLNHPKSYTEKLQWYKLNYRDPLMTQCADKYRVREYVKSKGLEDILVPLYGVYDEVSQIDFESLPNQFVIKTTNGSHTNIICKSKKELNIKKTKETLSGWLNKKRGKLGREWAYYNIEPKIIIEKYLEQEKTKNEFEGIDDYKFLCFNGKPHYIILDVDRYKNHKRNYYDTMWNKQNIKTEVENINVDVSPPQNLEEMLKIAKVLSYEFPHVRVDLYNIDGKIYFGELTFYNVSGYRNYEPDEFDYILGRKFKLETYKNNLH